jgi:uncharacterized glyoxalase superfamily protein PhnB
MRTTLPGVVPYLYYTDATAAVDFLVRAFGFEEHDVTRDADGIVWTAQLRTGPDLQTALVMVGPAMPEFGSQAVQDHARASARVHVLVPDIAKHYERAVAQGATIHTEPSAGFGGMLYVATDIGGHQWIFAEAPGALSKATSLTYYGMTITLSASRSAMAR